MTTPPRPPLWMSIATLICAIAIVGTNALLLSPLVQPVGASLSASPTEVLWAASGYGLGVAAAALLIAPLGDRIGSGRLLRMALATLTIGFIASALAPSLWALIGAQVLCGLAGGAALPSIYTMAAVIAPKGREARTVGAVLTGWTLSLVFGVSLAAWSADLLGWRMIYGALAAFCGLVWWLSGPLAQLDEPGETATSPLSALRVPGMTRGILASVGLMLSFYATYSYTGAHATVNLGLGTAQAGLLPLTYGLGFGSAVFLAPFLDRIGLGRAASAIFVGLSVVYLSMGLTGDRYSVLLGLAVFWGVLQHLALNILVARLTALDPRQRGAIMGIYSTTTYLSVFAAPFVGGIGYQIFGFMGSVAISALLTGLAAVEALSLRRSPPRLSPTAGPDAPDAPA
ncbi:MFS transporter [Tritonibacter horizontis]|uniref:Inner membrane transport protein YdhP n=1 Tax=Tritonibacter horizontis TaxID=1768241 RepID=A0A132C0J1_9RHOB|nr:MFS transporter [Tritonibacter horizontis]KUP94105.1 inner membrane transport protein YdhP [Tritonibacter horizontis]